MQAVPSNPTATTERRHPTVNAQPPTAQEYSELRAFVHVLAQTVTHQQRRIIRQQEQLLRAAQRTDDVEDRLLKLEQSGKAQADAVKQVARAHH